MHRAGALSSSQQRLKSLDCAWKVFDEGAPNTRNESLARSLAEAVL